MNLLRQTITKRWLSFAIPATVIIAGFVAAVSVLQFQAALTKETARHSKAVGEIAAQLFGGLGRSLDLLVSMRDEPEFSALLNQPAPDLAPIETLFKGVISRRRDIQQIRWIDETGLERLRVERNSDQRIVRVAESQLQNKGDRDYFQAALEIPVSGLWVSTIDLNEENGVIQTPLTPTVRLLTPLVDASGQRRGILIINEQAQPLLDLVSRLGVSVDNTYLVDANGDYLVSPNSEDLWARQLGHRRNLQILHPALWSQIDSSAAGSVDHPLGRVSWQHVYAGAQIDRQRRLQMPDLTVVSIFSRDAIDELRGGIAAPWVIGGFILWLVLLVSVGRLAFLQVRARELKRRSMELERDQARKELAQAKAQAASAQRLADQFRRSNRDLDNFAFAAAHDLRTPVNSIHKYAELLVNDPLNGPQRDEINQRILSLALQLGDLIDGLQEYARLGRSSERPRPIELGRVFQQVWMNHLIAGGIS